MARRVVLGTSEIVVGVPHGGGQKYPAAMNISATSVQSFWCLRVCLVAPHSMMATPRLRRLDRKMNSNRVAFSSLT